jgi:hypothetical protein
VSSHKDGCLAHERWPMIPPPRMGFQEYVRLPWGTWEPFRRPGCPNLVLKVRLGVRSLLATYGRRIGHAPGIIPTNAEHHNS